MRRASPAVICLLLFASTLLAPPAFAAANRTPNQNKLLQGAYSFVFHGYSPEATTPYAGSGVLVFDGAGNVTSGSGTFVEDGLVATPKADLLLDQPHDYFVGPDGSGTLHVSFATLSGFGFTFVIAVTDNGNRIFLNITGRLSAFNNNAIPTTATGEAAKQ